MRLITTSFGLSGCLVGMVLAACSSGSQGVASKYVASAVIGPEGGTIPVSASDDATLAGTTIVIPKNALTTSTTISIGLASGVTVAPTGKTVVGPVVDFEPAGTVFAVPVTITIPVTTSASAKSVFIEAVEADGSTKELAVQSISSGLASFQANGFTNFGAWTNGTSVDGGINPGDLCSTDADCDSDSVCVNGHCENTPVPDAGTDVNVTSQGCSDDSDCASGEICSGGVCKTSTTDASVDAGVNPGDLCSTDADCGSGTLCVNGHCDGPTSTDAGADAVSSDASVGADGSVCAAPLVDCSGVCTDIDSDADNCGTCGEQCSSGELCSSGACTN